MRSNTFTSIAAAIIGCLAAHTALATLTVQQYRGGTNGNSGTAFYYEQSGTSGPTGPSPKAFYDQEPSGYQYSDIDISQHVNTTTTDVNSNGMIYFQITSSAAATTTTTTTTTGSAIFVEVLSNGTAGTPAVYLPIAVENGVRCDQAAGACGLAGYNQVAAPYDYYGVSFTQGGTLNIAFFLSDICLAWTDQNGSALPGCTGIGVTPLTVGAVPAVFYLVVQLWSIPDITANGPALGKSTTPVTGTALDTSANFTVNLQADAPTIGASNCNPTQPQIYFPGDSQILLQTSGLNGGGGFGLNTTAPAATGQAPMDDIIVLGSLGANFPAPTSGSQLAAPTPGTIDVISRVKNNIGETPVTGFLNTTDGNDNKYQVTLAGRDLTGLVAIPDTSATAIQGIASDNCLLANVQASAINGFLKSNACFIATAAYRDDQAAPVVMLREFRDRILLHYRLGQEFVNWYYSWSPTGAEWLLAHPVFRYPVLVALVPLEILAWFGLHPQALIAGLAFLLGAWCLIAFARGDSSGARS